MKNAILILSLLICFFANSQISSFPYTQTFSNTVPADFTSTSNSWNFTNNVDARTGVYSAGLTPAIANNTNYIYIRISVISGYTYDISLYSKKICTLKINANENADQTTLLSTTSYSIGGCNGNGWRQSTLSYTAMYDGDMYFQILAPAVSGTEIYIDDIEIIATPPVSLPITLLYFRGEHLDSYNRITWSTATETNNDYFLLERTKNGFEFNIVCQVGGAGNSTTQMFYEEDDAFFFDGVIYYRLRQFDFDGAETTHDLISVDNRNKVSPTLLKITNVLGQHVSGYENDIILLFHYDNGTVVKRYFSK